VLQTGRFITEIIHELRQRFKLKCRFHSGIKLP
jgi:hypothetical protein